MEVLSASLLGRSTPDYLLNSKVAEPDGWSARFGRQICCPSQHSNDSSVVLQ